MISKPKVLLAFIISLLVVLGIFGRCLDDALIADDFNILKYGSLKDFWQKHQDPSFRGNLQYRLLGRVIWAIGYGLWKDSPLGYHLLNLITHLLNGVLVYIILSFFIPVITYRILGMLIFLLHPSGQEAVAYVSAWFDSLYAFFFMLSLVFFILWREGKKTKSSLSFYKQNYFYLISLGSYILCLFSKEPGVALPIVLIFYDLFFVSGLRINYAWARKLFLCYLPFFLVTLGFLKYFKITGQASSKLEFIVWLFSFSPGELYLRLQSVFIPFWLIFSFILLMYLITREKAILWGMLIVFMVFLPAFQVPFAFRHAYLPALGMALTLSLALWKLQVLLTNLKNSTNKPKKQKLLNFLSSTPMVVFFLLIIIYGYLTIMNLNNWAAAAQLSKTVPEQLKSLYPQLPTGSHLYFSGIPAIFPGTGGITTFQLDRPIKYAYHYQDLQTHRLLVYFNESGIFRNQVLLQNALFFQYKAGKLVERADLKEIIADYQSSGLKFSEGLKVNEFWQAQDTFPNSWQFQQNTNSWQIISPTLNISPWQANVIALEFKEKPPFVQRPEWDVRSPLNPEYGFLIKWIDKDKLKVGSWILPKPDAMTADLDLWEEPDWLNSEIVTQIIIESKIPIQKIPPFRIRLFFQEVAKRLPSVWIEARG